MIWDFHITQGKINSDWNAHLPLIIQILEQTRSHIQQQLVESYATRHLTLSISQLERVGLVGHFNASGCRLYLAVEFVIAMILVIVDGNSKWKLLVVIAEFSHSEGCWLPPGVDLIMGNQGAENFHHIVSIFIGLYDLSGALNDQVWLINAEAEELLRF